MSIPYVYNRTGESYKIPEWTLDFLVLSGFACLFSCFLYRLATIGQVLSSLKLKGGSSI